MVLPPEIEKELERMDIAAFELAAAVANGDAAAEDKWRGVHSEAMNRLAPFILAAD